MTAYPFRSALIVPAEQRDAANALAAAVTGGDPVAEALTYAVPLAATSAGPATHYGCCTLVRAAMLAAMQRILASGDLPGIRFYRWDTVSLTLVSTNSPQAATILGTSPWDWNRSLADGGWKVVSDADSR